MTALLCSYPLLARGEPQPNVVQAPATSQPNAVATFVGGSITQDDLQTAFDRNLPARPKTLALDVFRQQLLSRMIDYDVLALEAQRRGYGEHPAVRQAVKRAALDALLRDELAHSAPAPDSPEVAAYFAAHQNDFARPALRRASHIQVSTEVEARALLASLAGATRAHFAAVARARSQDEHSKRQGGELGYCDQQGRPFEGAAGDVCSVEIMRAAFELSQSGALAPNPVAHDGVFSVVMLTGVMPGKTPSLDRVRGKIVASLADESRQQREAALEARLRAANAPVVHDVAAIDAIVLPAPTARDIPAGFPAAPLDPRQGPPHVEPDEF
jgi:hypothetical protein